MPTSDYNLGAIGISVHAADDATQEARFAERLPPLLSVIAGMVDLTGFFTLGNIFTAHITGNLVVAAAAVVHGGPTNLAQLLAIPVFILALAAVLEFALLAAVWIFCVLTRPSNHPHGVTAGIAVMIAVSAMACQYALLRLAAPAAISTAVMTANLTNAVLALMDLLFKRDSSLTADRDRLKRSAQLLFGFLFGCVIAAAAVALFSDWAWAFPVALSAVAVALR